jgi:DNA polymerase III alpha subunit
VAVGVIVHRKDIITKKDDEMCFIGLELPDHYCLDVVVFPDQFNDYGRKLKVGRIVRLALKNDKKATVMTEDGVLSTHGYVTRSA